MVVKELNMYRLLDLRNCESELRVGPNNPCAVLDTEDAAIAAITKNGHLIYCNRAFILRNQIEYSGGHPPNIREVLPDIWDPFQKPPLENRNKLVKVINVRSSSGNKLLGHLLIFFEKKDPERSKIDFITVLSADNHPKFVNEYNGLYVASPEAYTIKVNPAYEKIAFLPESDLVGRNLKELVEKGYFSKSVTLSVLNKLKCQDTSNVSFFQKIISGKDVLVTGKPIYREHGELAYILTFVQDLLPLEIMARKCIEYDDKLSSWRPGAQLLQSSKVETRPGGSSFDLPAFDSLPIVAKDPLSISTLKQVVCASKYDSPILLTGETGVGKDLIAKYVHLLQSDRQNKPFVIVNCSAIPGELLESELFGYEEGAFSGARKGGRAGLFAEAEGGILFLNEISEMPLCLQAKLLTVLDEGCIRPLGSSKTKQIKTRIVCATNKDLRNCIDQGSFRSDLYYRIKVLTVHIPPLRDRAQDILPLIYHFMARLSAEHRVRKHLSSCIQEILLKYTWPGNVRELRNLVERLLVFSPTCQISLCDLPPEYLMKSSETGKGKSADLAEGLTLKEAVRQYEACLIKGALAKYGKVAEAASILGIDPTTLSRKLKLPAKSQNFRQFCRNKENNRHLQKSD
jgi:transcriptional regulator with PAS, ATPase and Fis domain